MPDAESACDIADALGVSVEYLVRGAEGPTVRRKTKRGTEERRDSALI